MQNENRNDYMINEDLLGADAGMDIALRFSALVAQADEGKGIYEDAGRASSVLGACREFFEDAKRITQAAALSDCELDDDMLEEAVRTEQHWNTKADPDGYETLADRLGATDRSLNQQSFEALQKFAEALRDTNALEGVTLPIQGVEKDDSLIPASVEKASAQEFYGLAATEVSPDSVKLLGNELKKDEAFSVLHSFTETFRPENRDSIMQELDSVSAGTRARSMLFQAETYRTGQVMEHASQELQNAEYGDY